MDMNGMWKLMTRPLIFLFDLVRYIRRVEFGE
jgi:hypothetical protein